MSLGSMRLVTMKLISLRTLLRTALGYATDRQAMEHLLLVSTGQKICTNC